jgi:hypothetical protein
MVRDDLLHHVLQGFHAQDSVVQYSVEQSARLVGAKELSQFVHYFIAVSSVNLIS